MTFSKQFVLGTATASYQVEGAVAEGGRAPSIWDTMCRTPGKVMGGDTGDVACDQYHLFRDDVALMADLEVDAYRFSISWSRVIPDAVGALNPEGVAYYRALCEELHSRGITGTCRRCWRTVAAGPTARLPMPSPTMPARWPPNSATSWTCGAP